MSDLQQIAITGKMGEADVTQNLTAAYANDRFSGCGSTAISLGLRGGFSAELFKKLIDTLDELIELRRLCHPIPVDMRRVQEVLSLLKQMRRGEPIVLQPLPSRPTPPKPSEAPELDDELIASVLTGDYGGICERRGWTTQQLREAIAANAEKMRQTTEAIANGR